MTTTRRVVHIDAQPERVRLDTAKTAVLVCDMQNDFGAVGGMFHRAGIDITPIQAAVAPTARVLRAARAAGLPIVFLKMEYRPDLADAGAPDSPNWRKHLPLGGIGTPLTAPDGRAGRILIRDTWNTEVVPELTPAPGDLVVSKQRYSGFYETDLDAQLRSRGVTTLLVTGCTTSVCVESTIRDAMFRDYGCVLLTDCSAEPIGAGLARSNHAASVLVMQLLLGWTATSDAVLAALGADVLSAVG